jgi:hypothetical protein
MSTLEVAVPRPSLRARLHDFFYSEEVPYGLAIMRISVTCACLVAMAYRWTSTRELFSSDGSPVCLWGAFLSGPWFAEPSGALAVAINSVLLLTLVTSCIGWCTRLSLWYSAIAYTFLNVLDIIGTMNKVSVIAIHLLFLLAFSNCGSLWSVDNWLRRARLRREGVPPEVADQPRRFPAWPRQLMQILVGAIYVGAAITKLHIPAFFSGEQMQSWMITTYNYPNPLGDRFALHISILVAFAYVTTVWEILFIFLSWRGIGRIAMIALGSIFHLMTLFTLGLYIFPWVCISAYLSFLNENDVDRCRTVLAGWRVRGTGLRAAIGRLFRQRAVTAWRAPRPALSHAMLFGLAAVTAVGGIAIEYRLDPYGLRRPEGPYHLQPLDPGYATEVLGPTKRIANADKVMTFDVGSIVAGGAILDRCNEFRAGETLQAQCGIVPPHEDLWCECNLHDAEDQVVDTTGVFVASESMRAIFTYTFNSDIKPGPYSLVLKVSGEEVMRRPITILPSGNRRTASAN